MSYTSHLGFRCQPFLKRKLETEAHDRNIQLSELIRIACERLIGIHGSQPPAPEIPTSWSVPPFRR